MSRLEEAVDKNVPLIHNHAPEVIEHRAGGEFAAGAYWKKLDPEAEVIDEEVNVDGIRFRGPTVPSLDHDNTTLEDRPNKRNCSDTFDRSQFIREIIILPQRTAKGMLMKNSHGKYVYKEWHQMPLYPILIFCFCTILTLIPILQNGLIFSFPNRALKIHTQKR